MLTQLGQLLGDLQLLLAGQGGARRLLAVAQGGVEDAHVVGVINAVGHILWALAGLSWGRASPHRHAAEGAHKLGPAMTKVRDTLWAAWIGRQRIIPPPGRMLAVLGLRSWQPGVKAA